MASISSSGDVGQRSDPEATGDGSLIAVAKRQRSILALILAAITGTLIVSGTVAIAPQPVSVTATIATPLPVILGATPQPVSGTVTANAGTGTFAVALGATPQPVSGTVTANAGTGTLTVAGTVTANAGSGTMRVNTPTTPVTCVNASNAAPAASAVQADTGALAAGTYDFDFYLAADDTTAVGKGLVIEHRNAANSATSMRFGGAAAPGNQHAFVRNYAIALNERVRVIAGTAAGTASSLYVSAICYRLSP